jgi:hypothetical protein
MAAVKANGKYGYINEKGAEVIPCIYENACNFSDGLACVKAGGKCGFIDKRGKTAIPFVLDHDLRKSEGMVRFRENGKYGYFNIKGDVAVPPLYDVANDFKEGLALVGIHTKDYPPRYKYGFIDVTGETAIPFTYEYDYGMYAYYRQPDVGDFHGGIARVKSNGKWGYINKGGETVVPIENDVAFNLGGGVVIASKGGEWGITHCRDTWQEFDTYTGKMSCINTRNNKTIFSSLKIRADEEGYWSFKPHVKLFDGLVIIESGEGKGTYPIE